MYDKNDPRSTLAPAGPAKAVPPAASYFGSQYAHFDREPPQLEDATGKTWIARAQAFVLAYTQAAPGASFSRDDQPDEYVVLLPDAASGAVIETPGGTETVAGARIAFVPPGPSRVTLPQGGILVRLFTSQSPDMTAAAANAASFATPNRAVAPFTPWPDPPGGLKLRHYSLDVPEVPGRFGRIFRCTTFMVNYLYPRIGKRDPKAVSPHHHDDFEQGSLALAGAFRHHLRWPWTTDMTIWRDDEHVTCGSPSLAVIPPPAIHTTTSETPGVNQLVDIFCPPRMDFSLKPGWVLNETDYPMPG